MLVARALLRSEPFSTWGLRVSLFEEWAWAAWSRLEAQLAMRVAAASMTDEEKCVGLTCGKSRLGRVLHSNEVVCDFHGVDRKKVSLFDQSPSDRAALKLPEEERETSSRSGSSNGKREAVQEGAPPGLWPERLPRIATARAMGASWRVLECAPMASPASALAQDSAEGDKVDDMMKDGEELVQRADLPALKHLDCKSRPFHQQEQPLTDLRIPF